MPAVTSPEERAADYSFYKDFFLVAFVLSVSWWMIVHGHTPLNVERQIQFVCGVFTYGSILCRRWPNLRVLVFGIGVGLFLATLFMDFNS